jgi:hypothetical protein
VNGFDNTFTYGFEDGDFGNRLINYGLTPATVRWTANVLHLDHGRPYVDQEQWEKNRRRQTAVEPGGPYRCRDGLDELEPEPGDS